MGLRFRPVGLRFRPLGLRFRPLGLRFRQAGTKVGPDQLGPPVRVGSTRIDSDRPGPSRIMKKNIKLNEIETFTHLKVKIPVKSGPRKTRDVSPCRDV